MGSNSRCSIKRSALFWTLAGWALAGWVVPIPLQAEPDPFAGLHSQDGESLAENDLGDPSAGDAETVIRLSLTGPILASVTTSSEEDGIEVEAAATTLALPMNSVALGLGVAPSRKFNLGLDLGVGSTSSVLKVDGEDLFSTKSSSFGAGPYLELVFSDAGSARPSLRAQLNYAVATHTSTSGDGDTEFEDEESLLRFAIGPGVQLFPAEQFSIDLRADLVYGTSTLEGDSYADKLETSGLGVVFSLGMSGWFGRNPPPSVAPESAVVSTARPISSTRNSAPAPAPPRDDSIKLRFENGIMLMLAPSEDDLADATFIVPFSIHSEADCSQSSYAIDEMPAALALSPQKTARGNEEVLLLRGGIPMKAISGLSKADTARFEICDTQLSLDHEDKIGLRRYRKAN